MTDQITMQEFVDRINDKTAGNRGDYLTRGDVEQIVYATLEELYGSEAVKALTDTGIHVGMSDPSEPTTEPREELPDDESGEPQEGDAR